MALWALEATAVADDTRWLDFPIWADVVVRAPSAAQARLVAADMEAAAIGDPTTLGNETLAFRSGFQDEKLYHARRIRPDGVPEEGPPEVISARQARPPGRT